MQKRLIGWSSVVLGLAASLTILFITSAAGAATSITVTTTNDTLNDDGFCSLREAVRAANLDLASGSTPGECPAGSGEDVIILPPGTYTLTLSGQGEDASLTGDLDVTDSLTMFGTGSASTIIDGGGIDRIFHIIRSGNLPVEVVNITGMTLRDGDPGAEFGGAIQHDTILNLTDVVLRDNTASSGGAIYLAGGPADLTLLKSTIYSNTASVDDGGAILNNSGDISIIQSAVTFNHAELHGGGIRNAGGTIQIVNSTFSGNTAKGLGGAIRTNTAVELSNATLTGNQSDVDNIGSGGGGGIYNDGNDGVTLKNTILAGNTDSNPAEADCAGPVTSLGYNLFGSDLGGCAVVLVTGDITATIIALGPLQDNGGATFTHALLAGSPAIDAGNPADPGTGGQACEPTDQRLFDRPVDGDGDESAICDIGSFELGAVPRALRYLPVITRNP